MTEHGTAFAPGAADADTLDDAALEQRILDLTGELIRRRLGRRPGFVPGFFLPERLPPAFLFRSRVAPLPLRPCWP